MVIDLFMRMEGACAYDLAVRKQRKRRLYCEHCEQYLSKSTYYRHKSKYYDPSNRTWSKCANVDDIETASSSEHLGEEEDIVFQDCVDVYYTEEADDNSDDSNIDSFGLSPPSRATAIEFRGDQVAYW